MRRLAVLSLIAIVGATACGGDDDGGTASTTGASAAATTAAAGGAEPTTEATESSAAEDTAAGGSAPDGTTSDGTTDAGGSVADNEQAYIDALLADFGGSNEDVGRCVSTALIQGVGLEQLQAADVSPDELRESGGFDDIDLELTDRAATEAAVAQCGDDNLAFELGVGENTPEAQACAEEHLTDEMIARFVVGSSIGEAPSQEDQDSASAFDECMQSGS